MKGIRSVLTYLFGKSQEGDKKRSLIRTICFTTLAIGNLFGVFLGTYAWFVTTYQRTQLETASGELGVTIEKITVHKYVYPYFGTNTEMIDYNSPGTIKSYVVEDSYYETNYAKPSQDDSVVDFNSFTGEVDDLAYYSVNPAETHTYNCVYYDETSPYRYFLIGNNVFNANSLGAWSSTYGMPFPGKDDGSAVLNNVVISAGAEFMFFDAQSNRIFTDINKCEYQTFSSITASSRFVLTNNGATIKCIRSGVYNFTYHSTLEHVKSLTIERVDTEAEEAIIGNNVLDPTMIKINYIALPELTKETMTQAEYTPQAIKDQNTMVIFELYIRYDNANATRAGLKVWRNLPNSYSVYNLPGKYGASYAGGVDGETTHSWNASDFYSFSAVFTQTPYLNSAAIWEGLHGDDEEDAVTPYTKSKFSNLGETFDASIDCPLNTINGASTTLQPTSSGQHFYCYIGVDYDADHCQFFFNEQRLGKTYALDRDFTFRLTAEQIKEEA